jgi:hypothetical protein
MTTTTKLRLGLAGLVVVAIALTASLVMYVAGRDEPDAFTGEFTVLKVGELKATQPHGEIVYLFQDREFFASGFPELARYVDDRFDFSRHHLVVWIRPAPFPFGASDPAPRSAENREAGEPELRIEWSSRCAVAPVAQVFAVIAVPAGAFLYPGWSVRHSVPAAEASAPGRVQFKAAARGMLSRRHDEAVVVLSSPDDLENFLVSESGPGVAALRTIEVDFTRDVLIGVFAPEYARRTIELVQASEATGTVVTSLVRVGGVVPAVAVAWFDFVMVPKQAVQGVKVWTRADDGAVRLAGAC